MNKERDAAWKAWFERLLEIDGAIGALVADWPLDLGPSDDVLAASEIARDGLALMIPTDDDGRTRLRRMRAAQLGVRDRGAGRTEERQGVTMALVASLVLEAVHERKRPQSVNELVIRHLVDTLRLHIPSEAKSFERLRAKTSKTRVTEWLARYTPSRPRPHSGELALAGVTARILHESRALSLSARPDDSELAETTKEVGVCIRRYGLRRRFGVRADIARLMTQR